MSALDDRIYSDLKNTTTLREWIIKLFKEYDEPWDWLDTQISYSRATK
jgi:hypothetical protein